MYLHLTSDTYGHQPNVGLDFRDDRLGIDARIGLTKSCGDEDCHDEHPETVVLSLRHIPHEDAETDADVRDDYVPTVRILMDPRHAALAIAIWVRMFSEEHPDILAEAMDRAAEVETIIRGD